VQLSSCGVITHVRLDVLVLEVEGVLPDVDADDRDVGWGVVSASALSLRSSISGLCASLSVLVGGGHGDRVPKINRVSRGPT
jgi:hypothetical protein